MTSWSSAYKVHWTWFGGGRVTVLDAEILKVAQKAFGHPIRLTQGGLSRSVAASALTHAGVGCLDISVAGLSKSQVWRLCSILLECGMIPFPRGYNPSTWGRDPFAGNRHIHVCSKESYASLHWQAKNQVKEWERHGAVSWDRDGLVGRHPYTGPSTKLTRWAKSKWNPKNQKKAVAAAKKKAATEARKNQTDSHVDPKTVRTLAKPVTYYVIRGPLLGLHVTRKPKKGTSRTVGEHFTVSKLVYRWGRWNAVTTLGTYWAITAGGKAYLSTKNPKPAVKPAPAPVVVVTPKPTTSTGVQLLHPSVAKALVPWLRLREGVVPGLYLDTKGKVTCGVGLLCDSVDAAQKLPWLTKAGKKATPAQVEAEWKQIKARQTLKSAGGYAFIKHQTLHLTDAAINDLLARTLTSFVTTLAKSVPGFANLPADAQMSLVDEAYQNGASYLVLKNAKGAYVWANTRAAVLAGDWAKAAKAVPGSATSVRRIARVRWFNNAAKVKALKLDPSVFWDTKTPKKPVKPTVTAVVALAVAAATVPVTAAVVSTPSAPVPAPTVTVSAAPTPVPSAAPTPAASPSPVSRVTVSRDGVRVVCTAPCTVDVVRDGD